ncbi:2'-5' RNA ligase family protein [Microbacterium sp. GCS4]|uniref:2'-5' RNA ligase family protein n=1 Tax=Microbacterium sp. GCS4 TaxID=1692239 RepID=UPI0009E338F1|nr:2'-5' RNA ligase family protein [Microbacterium sp. GCS4]
MSSLARHIADSNRPHLTLVVRVDLPLPDTGDFADLRAIPITLGAPVLFGAGDRRVLARSVVTSAELLDLHRAVHAAVGAGEDALHTAPGEWTPHVTLARRVRVAHLAEALDAVGGEVRGHARPLRHWDPETATVTPVAELRSA